MAKKQTYIIKNSQRAKRLRLAVYCDGSVVVTAPLGINQSIIDKFMADKKQWLADKINFFKSIDSKAIRTFSEKDYLDNKDRALKLVLDRVETFKSRLRFSYKAIKIKNQKTRWGSCSRNKNLNFNYKLIFLPKKQQDYIIIHELCHLKEFNHSRKFWSLVEKIMPDYLEIKNELRNHELFYK